MTTPTTMSQNVSAVCEQLQRAYLAGSASAKADLAELRKAVAAEIPHAGLSPVAVDVLYTVAGDRFHMSAPNDDGEVGTTAYDRAWFVALTLFAQHMRSAKSPVHYTVVDKPFAGSFGSACGRLVAKRNTSGTLANYIRVLLRAQTQDAMEFHLRRFVNMFNAEGVGLNYGLFASDLVTMMSSQTGRRRVLSRWARDYQETRFRPAQPSK